MTSDNNNLIEVDHAVAIASAIVSIGCQTAPALRRQIIAFGNRVGVVHGQRETETINLVAFEQLVRFANSVEGQAAIERIWHVLTTVDEPIHDSFNADGEF